MSAIVAKTVNQTVGMKFKMTQKTPEQAALEEFDNAHIYLSYDEDTKLTDCLTSATTETIRKALSARQWMPIESAPIGVSVLTWRARNPDPRKNSVLCGEIFDAVKHEGWTTWSRWPSYFQPTHWQPLPVAPPPGGEGG